MKGFILTIKKFEGKGPLCEGEILVGEFFCYQSFNKFVSIILSFLSWVRIMFK